MLAILFDCSPFWSLPLLFSFFEICWLLWKQCCFGFGWSCLHKCSIKSFIKWVNIYSGRAYMELDVMIIMITHAEQICTFIVIFLVCLNVCNSAWNALSLPLWFGCCHLKANTQRRWNCSKLWVLSRPWTSLRPHFPSGEWCLRCLWSPAPVPLANLVLFPFPFEQVL